MLDESEVRPYAKIFSRWCHELESLLEVKKQ